MKSQVLVTGGAGFIGSHLCRGLVAEGFTVRVLDIKRPTEAIPGVEYLLGDITHPMMMRRAVAGVSAVYHLAAIVSVPLCHEQTSLSYQVNLVGTVQVLEAIKHEMQRQSRPVRMIFASSSAVYGHNGVKDRGLSEGALAQWPLSYYAAQKLGSEQAIRLFHQFHSIPALSFRFFNVFGPGQDASSPYSGVISIFLSSLASGRELFLHGGGDQTRDFVSVYDIRRALILANQAPPESCRGQAINLGTGDSVSIRTLMTKLSTLSGLSVKSSDTPARPGDVLHSRAEIGLAEEVLGWKPTVTLDEGLRELLSVFGLAAAA